MIKKIYFYCGKNIHSIKVTIFHHFYLYPSLTCSTLTLCATIATIRLQNLFIFPNWDSVPDKDQLPRPFPSNPWQPPVLVLSLWV